MRPAHQEARCHSTGLYLAASWALGGRAHAGEQGSGLSAPGASGSVQGGSGSAPQPSAAGSAPAASTSSPPTPSSPLATRAPLDDVKLSDAAAARLLDEEERRRKERRKKKGRIRELEEVSKGAA